MGGWTGSGFANSGRTHMPNFQLLTEKLKRLGPKRHLLQCRRTYTNGFAYFPSHLGILFASSVRDRRLMQTLLQDLHYAVRILKKNLGFTAAVTLTFALGIGCTTAVFTFVDALLLRKLPARSPEQLVVISAPGGNPNLKPRYLSHAFYQHLRRSNPIFTNLVAISVAVSSGINLRAGDSTDRVRAELSSRKSVPLSRGLSSRPRESGTDFRELLQCTRSDDNGGPNYR